MTVKLVTDISLHIPDKGVPRSSPIGSCVITTPLRRLSFSFLMKEASKKCAVDAEVHASCIAAYSALANGIVPRGDTLAIYTDVPHAFGKPKELLKKWAKEFGVNIYVYGVESASDRTKKDYQCCHVSSTLRSRLKYGKHKNKPIKDKRKIMHSSQGKLVNESMWY